MALELRQQQKLSQQLVFTLQMQQAIKLLQLNHQEMVEMVKTELVENPALEEVIEGAREDGSAESSSSEKAEAPEPAAPEVEGTDWAKMLEQYSSPPGLNQNAAGPSRFDDLPPIEQSLSASTSLSEHLLWQLGLQLCSEEERIVSIAIIHNLDHRGYLDCSMEQIIAETGVDELMAEDSREMVMGMDPLGCGSADLLECLRYQCLARWPEDEVIHRILTDHMGDLESRNYAAIAKCQDIEVEDVVEYHRMIQTLEPWPGRPYAEAPNQYITPDIEVVKMGGEWTILQNDDGMPRLRVSNYYRKVLTDKLSSKEDKQYIKERLDSADFLIKSIYQRQRTIHRVMNSILERQKGFFDHGAEHLTPMILRDVADAIGVHESTVSRVTTNKYVQCPHGIFELKYFFNAAIQTTYGGELAAEAVKEKIRKLIADENSKKPLSDSKLVKLLAQQDIVIARRTVAKYREAMGILPSSKRKSLF